MSPYITANPSRTTQPALDQQLTHLNRQYEQDDDSQVLAVPRHPLGVKPSGNSYAATTNDRVAIGSFAALPDEILLNFLEYLDETSLLKLGATCRALYVFSRTEDLWKTLFLEYGSLFPLQDLYFSSYAVYLASLMFGV